MFLSREINIKLCQIFTKIHIYMQFCIKVVVLNHIQQIRNQSENDDNPQEPENLRFAPIFFFLHF